MSFIALVLLFFCCKFIDASKRRSRMANNRVVYTNSPGWLQTQRPNVTRQAGGQNRANSNLFTRPQRNRNHTPSAPPAANVYTIPDASTDKPPDVSLFNPPTYEEATTTGNVYWDPSSPDQNADKKY